MHANPPLPCGAQPGMSAGHPVRLSASTLRPALAGAVLLAAYADAALAYTATLTAVAPQMIYLQVGNGTFTGGNYTPIQGNGQPTGTPGNNATVNTVSTNLTLAAVGNGTPQPMTTNSTATQSFWDGYTYCSVPAQLYIGGNTAAAQVTATVPAALIDTTGDTLPFSKISWTSSGNGDFGAEPFPAGTFVNGGVQTVGSMASNTWNESCWTFSYLNNTVPKSGVYSGTVIYTMSTP
jgi:hypothetical protein